MNDTVVRREGKEKRTLDGRRYKYTKIFQPEGRKHRNRELCKARATESYFDTARVTESSWVSFDVGRNIPFHRRLLPRLRYKKVHPILRFPTKTIAGTRIGFEKLALLRNQDPGNACIETAPNVHNRMANAS